MSLYVPEGYVPAYEAINVAGRAVHGPQWRPGREEDEGVRNTQRLRRDEVVEEFVKALAHGRLKARVLDPERGSEADLPVEVWRTSHARWLLENSTAPLRFDVPIKGYGGRHGWLFVEESMISSVFQEVFVRKWEEHFVSRGDLEGLQRLRQHLGGHQPQIALPSGGEDVAGEGRQPRNRRGGRPEIDDDAPLAEMRRILRENPDKDIGEVAKDVVRSGSFRFPAASERSVRRRLTTKYVQKHGEN